MTIYFQCVCKQYLIWFLWLVKALKETAEKLEGASDESQEKLTSAFEIAGSLRKLLEDREQQYACLEGSSRVPFPYIIHPLIITLIPHSSLFLFPLFIINQFTEIWGQYSKNMCILEAHDLKNNNLMTCAETRTRIGRGSKKIGCCKLHIVWDSGSAWCSDRRTGKHPLSKTIWGNVFVFWDGSILCNNTIFIFILSTQCLLRFYIHSSTTILLLDGKK